jgi:uncharacterized membrane protein
MKSFPEELAATSAQWVREGLITPEQRERLLARHPTEVGTSRLIVVFGAIGALALTLGLMLVVNDNWAVLGKEVKIGLVIVLMLAAYAFGWRLKVSPGNQSVIGDVCLSLGCVLFLAGVFLVGDLYYASFPFHRALMISWIGIAAVPWLTRSSAAQFVSLLVLVVWMGSEFTNRGGLLGCPNGVYDFTPAALLALLGLAVFFTGIALRSTKWEFFADLHENGGLAVFIVLFYYLGYAEKSYHDTNLGVLYWPPLGFAVVMLVLGFLAALRHRRAEALLVSLPLALAVVVVIGVQFGLPSGLSELQWSTAVWGSLLVFDAVLLRAGVQFSRESWITIGVFSIAVTILSWCLYNFANEYEQGLSTILGGLLLIILAVVLEKRRRVLINRIRRQSSP